MSMMSLCETYNSEWRGSVSCKRSRVLQVESVWLFYLGSRETSVLRIFSIGENDL